MKKFLLVASAAAVASAFGGAAFAATNIDAGTGSGGTYASEVVFPTATVSLEDGAAADQTATVAFGASFASDAVAYVRFDLPTGKTFTAAPSYAINDNNGAADVSVAQGGVGQSFVVFAVAPNGMGDNLVGANIGTFTANGITVSNKDAVTLTYKLFETLTNAANNTLALKTASATFLTFANAIAIAQGTALSRTADVAATGGAYRTFLNNSTEESLLSFTVSHTARAQLSGAATTAATVLADTNDVSITGDFSAAAVNGVTLNTQANCGGGSVAATTTTGTSATFANISAANITAGEWFVCYEVNGTAQIAAASYSGSIDLDGQSGPPAYLPGDGSTGTGTIVRNGTVLKAAFADTAGAGAIATGFNGAYLTNLGNNNANYTVRCLLNTGAATGTPGVVNAGSAARLSFTGSLGCPSTGTLRGIELTFDVPTGNMIGSIVRRNDTTGAVSFDNMIGSN